MRFCSKLTAIALIFSSMSGALLAQIAAPSPPKLDAKGYLLIDFKSGQTLGSMNQDERLDPASITKLMTAYAVFRAIKSGQIGIDDEVQVSEKAWRTPGSRMFIEVGTRVPVELLLPGMIIQSGNDASVALAEHVAGTEETFAEVMNQLAAELGMTNTHYVNSTGLPAKNHYTSATDIAILATALIHEFPDYYRWYSQKQFSYNGISQGNRNTLLWRDESVDGMKTGYTESAGYCLVSSAKRNGMRLIAVVLGTKSPAARASESQALLNYGFRFYDTQLLWEQGEIIGSTRIWKGTEENIDLLIKDSVYVTIAKGTGDQLETTIEIPDQLMAPIQKAIPVGLATASLAGETVATADLYSSIDVPEGSLMQTSWDEVLLWFE
ncbi:MAG: D-alanyl-D-alanine carboxypeptidase [Gammaproteobacteria bacterium]|nr:D-alanyl-D-alanine carboxypeptidase [Gammaproteobacteria bacterium]MCP4089566.1 D-alanyl-D-alanine carboxypeptidase [Gammaproteobacteria bacterium]MCP4278099.1 D-alanyl-D-alanine carboxypeptidase [Gammaproteobacteria bacterium]MCP4832457.1 D-alanyl-D-alanine carboxypeptidase [Gammaproteobacteria bacterium]MCP4930149.1 D-alanyl-D-alanine carboxypeptidase [Gammaproteobacteria bacterium]